MDLISLLVLVAAIVIAFVCKVNTGLVAMSAALIVGRCAGVADKVLLKSFDSNLFLMLLGVMYLFCIAQENKTLDILAKKAISLCRGNVKLFPIIMFLVAAVLSAIGPGLISVTALVAAISVALAKQSGIDPIKLLPFGTLGSFAGGLSPITPSGLVAISKAEEAGIVGMEVPLMVKMAITCTASAIMTVLAGVMSWFSSASGVVMPTLIPTVPGITETLAGANAMEIAVGLCIGAHMAALSPLSSCGGLMLSAYSSSDGVTEKDRNRTFVQLFIMSATGVLFAGILALVGLYR